MCSLRRLPVAKNHNFGQILTFGAHADVWGLMYRPLSPMRAKFGVLEQTNGLRLCANFRLNLFILSPSGGEKQPKFYHFVDFGILWCRQLASI